MVRQGRGGNRGAGAPAEPTLAAAQAGNVPPVPAPPEKKPAAHAEPEDKGKPKELLEEEEVAQKD